MPLLLAGLPVHLALGLVSALLAVLSSALLLWRRSGSKQAVGTGIGASAAKKAAGSLQASKANGSAKQIEDPSLLDPSKPCCRILYGTQTGTAERFAKQLGKDLKKKFGDSTIIDVVDIENYRAAERLPNERLVVFCMATYGDGEPTDNAADFYNWLVKEGAAVMDGEKEPYLKARNSTCMAIASPAAGAQISRTAVLCMPLLQLLAGHQLWLQAKSVSHACCEHTANAGLFLTAVSLPVPDVMVTTWCSRCSTPCLAWATSSTSTSTRWAARCTSSWRSWVQWR